MTLSKFESVISVVKGKGRTLPYEVSPLRECLTICQDYSAPSFLTFGQSSTKSLYPSGAVHLTAFLITV